MKASKLLPENYDKSVFLKKAPLDTENTLLPKGDFAYPWTLKLGGYLLINEAYFNSSISSSGLPNNINQDGIYNTSPQLEENRKLIFNSNPVQMSYTIFYQTNL